MTKESLEKKRFRMVKAWHKKTFEEACKKSKVDRELIPLCKFIVGTENYFTSSCCSGRILLLGLKGRMKSKKDSYFHFKSHEKVKFSKIWNALNAKTVGELWFKAEPFILHVGTRNLQYAKKVLAAMKKAGVKRGGITVAKEGKFLIEMIGTQEIAVPVKKGNRVLVGEEFFKGLVEEGNEKLEKNLKQLRRVEKELKKVLK